MNSPHATRLILAALAVTLLTGCGVGGVMVKRSRHAQNSGTEMRGSLADAAGAAEAALRHRGFEVSSSRLYKGPGSDGKTITGKKNIQASGREIGTALATGLLGAQGAGAVKARYAKVVVEMNHKWADDFESGVQDTFVVRTDAKECADSATVDKKTKKKVNSTRCDPLAGFDVGGFEDGIRQKARASRPAAPATGSPQDEADYQAAMQDYNAGRHDDAWRKAYAIAQRNPRHWQSWQLIGNCQYAKGEKDGALASYKQSLQINPENVQLKNWVAQLMNK